MDSELREMETPVGVVDVERTRRNARKVASYARRHGLTWRPHVKTHKSLAVGRIQLEEGAAGLTVATPREAEVMASICSDLLMAYPPVGAARLRRLLALPDEVRISVALDSREALDGLALAASERGREVSVLIEIDAGMGRVGVTEPDRAVELAMRTEDTGGVRFGGVLFYPGHIRTRSGDQEQELRALSDQLARVVGALGEAGLPPACVSGGSTPTLWSSHEIQGLTEIRAGTCIFHDRDQLELGVCGLEECAYTVLTTVISTALGGQAVVDAGSKALAREPLRGGGEGFGLVLEHPEVLVRALSEEHGILDLSRTAWRPAVGEVVQVVPNHVCVSVNLQEHVLAVDQGTIHVWPVEARGRSALGSRE